MGVQAAAKGSHKGNWRYISIAALVLTGLLAVVWTSAQPAGASVPLHSDGQTSLRPAQATVGASDTQGVHSQGEWEDAQSRFPIHLPIPIPGANELANGTTTGPTPSSASDKGEQGGHLGGSALGSILSRLGDWATLPGPGGAGAGATGAAPAAPVSPACSPNWVVVNASNAAYQGSILFAVAEVGPTDVWAGGYYGSDASPSKSLPVFEHWDGTAWSAVAAALPAGGVEGQIWDISVNTSDDIWAVGYYADGTNSHVLIYRWNGLQWSIVTGVSPSSTENSLLGVAVVSTNNVWAAGDYTSGGVDQTLIEHWNGSAWSQVISPNQGPGNNALQDISVVPGSSGSDIWAVGYYFASPGGIQKTLTLHYDGTIWSYVASPDQGSGNNELFGVYAIAANDVWATGTYHASSTSHTLAEHWNGSAWTTSPSLDPGASSNAFFRVFATASNEVWAVGVTQSSTTIGALIERWNGSAWSVSLNTAPGIGGYGFGIAAGSSGDVWAVGFYISTSTPTVADVLTEHYNGASWSQVYSPDPPTGTNSLLSISANSSTDVWAVGYSQGYIGSTRVAQALIEHWDGSVWSIVAGVHPTTSGDYLGSVKAVSADDVWAVGDFSNGTKEQTFIEHWNGTAWGQISSPNPGGTTHDNVLVGVDAASANDIWAVGSYNNGNSDQTLIMHWNGSSWLPVSSPNPGAYADYLTDVTVVPGSGGNDVWAVGSDKNTSSGHSLSLLERWNGTTWSVVSSPNVTGADNQLIKMFAISANDVWAVGISSNSSSAARNLALHWDGTSWTFSSIVQDGPYDNNLWDVMGTASNDVYAVGVYANASDLPQALVEHWDGSAWSVVPSVPTPGLEAFTLSIVTVSSTDVWAVGLYVPTGFNAIQALAERYHPCVVSCSITFSDVPAGSTFYPYIHCLACLGIINGYPDGTFKPGANVTRGQLSKIVANSAGFSDPQPNQMFQDVPVGSTFQVFIGRLASRGYISGYACGGTGEPCQPGNLPYFRPGANATRGQISKIDSNAAGYHDNPSGQQFEDVPVGSTYYTYTYRLVSRTIMAGYACGHAPAGPCVAPGNLPYFVPNNNATRGQTSKIVSGTFFPGCSSLDAVKP